MLTTQEEIAAVTDTQAWRFAGLVQSRLTHPVGEKTIAVPAIPKPAVAWQVGCTGGAFTFIAQDGRHIRAVCEVEKECETWIDVSQDGGQTWQRVTTITKEDETIDDRIIWSVLHPYMYGKMVNGEPWVVLGVSVAEKDTKCWDIREREAPLAQLGQLKTAYVYDALPGNAQDAYKDGVPVQAPGGGTGVYFAATRHHIDGHLEEGVNADTVFCKLNEKTRRYEITGVILSQAARGGIDLTCNRLTCELVLPDGTRFWGCDVRNVEMENAALKSPLRPGDPKQWVLGDFNEITSFAVATWPAGAFSPKAASIDAVLGRSPHPRHPALRALSITPLVPLSQLAESADNDAVLLLTYERAGDTGIKSLYQQSISRQEMKAALAGKGPVLMVGEDPLTAQPAKQWNR